MRWTFNWFSKTYGRLGEWFAWYPVQAESKAGDTWVWLEKVIRFRSDDGYSYQVIEKEEKKTPEVPTQPETLEPNTVYHYSFMCPDTACGMESEGVMKGKEIDKDIELTCQWCGQKQVKYPQIMIVTNKEHEAKKAAEDMDA
jgi:hypothetical protein